MPQPLRPARLNWDKKRATYVIRDVGDYRERLGLGRDQRAQAEAALAAYVKARDAAAAKGAVPVIGASASEVPLADVIRYYCVDHAPQTSRPEEIGQKAAAILKAFGPIMIAGVNGVTCKRAAAAIGSTSYARECLSTLRAAIRLYAKDCGLQQEIAVWMPPKSRPRKDWLSKAEARALILTSWRMRDSQVRMIGPEGAKVPKRFETTRRRWRHLVQFIVVGIWTCTRTGRIQTASYEALPGRPWIDLDPAEPTYHRAAEDEDVADNKQAPTVPLNANLARHMRKWSTPKTVQGRVRPGHTYVVQYAGRPVDCSKSFRECVAKAMADYPHLFRRRDGSPKEIVRHSLRHTGITWRAQAGQSPLEICQYAGLSLETFQKHYAHACPSHLKGIA